MVVMALTPAEARGIRLEERAPSITTLIVDAMKSASASRCVYYFGCQLAEALYWRVLRTRSKPLSRCHIMFDMVFELKTRSLQLWPLALAWFHAPAVPAPSAPRSCRPPRPPLPQRKLPRWRQLAFRVFPRRARTA